MPEYNQNRVMPSGPLVVTAAVVWIIHFLPFLIPAARIWGFNHLIFLPGIYAAIVAIGGIISLAFLFSPLRESISRFYTVIAGLMFEKRSHVKWILTALVALGIFWIGRLPVFLLGDSHSIADNIGKGLPVIYKWSEIGAIYLAYLVSRLLPFTGSELGEYAYGIISVISGAVTVYLFCALAYELGRDAAGRLFIFMLSLLAGWIVLFFGYTENYPVLWPFVTAYIYFGVRYTAGKCKLVWPTVFCVLALVLHLQVLFFLVSYPVLVFSRGKPARIFQRRAKAVWLSAAVVILAAAVVFIILYHRSPQLQLLVMPLLTGHHPAPNYTLFSLSHLLDIVSELILLVPLLPMLLVMAWKSRRGFFSDATGIFLLFLSLGGLIFLCIIDPKLGMARDWDLFALAGLGPMLLLAKILSDSDKTGARVYPALTLLSLVLVLPFVATNMAYQPATDNYKSLLNLDLPKSRNGIIILRSIYRAQGDSLRVDSLGKVLDDNFPAFRLAPMAYELINEGKLDEASVLVDSIALFDPGSVELYSLRGTIYLQQGKYQQAIANLDKAARIGRYDSRVFISLAQAYNQLGRPDEMMNYLRKAQARDPHSSLVMCGLAVGFYTMRQFDSALAYAESAVQADSTLPDAYLAGGHAALQLGDRLKAKDYLTRYLELVPDGKEAEDAHKMLEQIK